MKNIFSKVLIFLISFMILSCHVYATEENNIAENTTTQNTQEEPKVEEKPTETKKNETMYVQERCNIRSSYSVDSERVGGLDVGTEVTVIAEYSNGWYKIKYDGGEAYIKAGILRSTKPEIPEDSEEEEQNQEENTPEQNVADTKLPAEENMDEVPIEDAELINEIGVLPEVGKNIADVLYLGVLGVAIVFVVYVKYFK